MAKEKNIEANILSAATKSIGDKMYGNMLLGVPDDDDKVRETIEYFRSLNDVVAEEVVWNAVK